MFRVYPRHSVRLAYTLFAIAICQLQKGNFKKKNVVETFEMKFADYIGVKYAVAVSACRMGIYLGLREGNLNDGDEVIMPAYTFKAVVLAVRAAGLKPVFVDIKETDCNIDESCIEIKITQKTKAILISHMFGFPCNMDRIANIASKHGIGLIEDVALSCGAEYKNKKLGSFGTFGVFSFGIGKNLPCFGGGMVVTNNEQLYKRLKEKTVNLPLSNRRSFFAKIIKDFICFVTTSYPVFNFIVFPVIFLSNILNLKYFDTFLNENIDEESFRNSISNQPKFTNLQATIGLYQLRDLDGYNIKILNNAARYDSLLDGDVKLCSEINPKDIKPMRHYYIIHNKNRDLFRKRLLFRGIDTQPDDMSNCSKVGMSASSNDVYPNTIKALQENMEIPNNVRLKEKDLLYVSQIIRNIS
jgi:dTDP-4-amino-4,6-dideoxygalactose transaminase